MRQKSDEEKQRGAHLFRLEPADIEHIKGLAETGVYYG